MTISVRCPKCGSVHQVGPELRGKRAKCRCGAILDVPASPQTPAQRTGTTAGQPARGPAAQPEGNIRVRCPGCGQIHQANASMAGTSARCQCGTVLRIPQQGGAAGAAPRGPQPGSNVASLLDELTERDRQRYHPVKQEPVEPAGPTDDEILSRYTFEKPTRRRNADARRPIGTIVLGVLEILGGLLSLLAAVFLALLIFGVLTNDRFLHTADGVDIGKAKAMLGFLTGVLALVAILYLVGAIGLFMGSAYGWWINICLMLFEPVNLLASVVISNIAALATAAEAMPTVAMPGAKEIIRCLVAVGILVYLMQRGVLDFFDIQSSRVVAIIIGVIVAAACIGILVAGGIAIAKLA